MEYVIGVAGGLIIAGLLGWGIFGCIIPVLILIGAGIIVSWTSCIVKEYKNEKESNYNNYPTYKY